MVAVYPEYRGFHFAEYVRWFPQVFALPYFVGLCRVFFTFQEENHSGTGGQLWNHLCNSARNGFRPRFGVDGDRHCFGRRTELGNHNPLADLQITFPRVKNFEGPIIACCCHQNYIRSVPGGVVEPKRWSNPRKGRTCQHQSHDQSGQPTKNFRRIHRRLIFPLQKYANCLDAAAVLSSVTTQSPRKGFSPPSPLIE